VHFMRNVLARVPRGNSEMVAAAIRTVFAQPDAEHVHCRLDVIAGMLGRQFPAVEAMLRDAAEDLLAFTAFPIGHRKEDLVDQSAGAAEQGDQAPNRRRRRLPQPRGPAPAGRRGPGRGPRRMAG
jgi:Transposase, Mutator family